MRMHREARANKKIGSANKSKIVNVSVDDSVPTVVDCYKANMKILLG